PSHPSLRLPRQPAPRREAGPVPQAPGGGVSGDRNRRRRDDAASVRPLPLLRRRDARPRHRAASDPSTFVTLARHLMTPPRSRQPTPSSAELRARPRGALPQHDGGVVMSPPSPATAPGPLLRRPLRPIATGNIAHR